MTADSTPAGRPYVAVVGPVEVSDTGLRNIAFEVGRLLASGGAVVVTGGLGGVMAAAAEGATSAGGLSIGLLPGTERPNESSHTYLLTTGLGELRNGLVVRSCHGLIAVGGSWGTLSEIALAMRLEIPVISIAGWRLHDEANRELPVDRAATASEGVARLLNRLRAVGST